MSDTLEERIKSFTRRNYVMHAYVGDLQDLLAQKDAEISDVRKQLADISVARELLGDALHVREHQFLETMEIRNRLQQDCLALRDQLNQVQEIAQRRLEDLEGAQQKWIVERQHSKYLEELLTQVRDAVGNDAYDSDKVALIEVIIADFAAKE